MTEFYEHGAYASDEQIMRWANSCRDIRFALECVEDLGTPEMIADAMSKVIEGIFDEEHAPKWIAFGSGLALLTGSPVPCSAAFSWAHA